MTTLEPIDQQRIIPQREFVAYALSKGEWQTLRQLADYARCSEAGASARIREIRARAKAKSEPDPIEKKRQSPGSGVWLYRMAVKGQRRLF